MMFCCLLCVSSQPALVVLVPACLLASILSGLWEGKLGELMAYNEEKEEEFSSGEEAAMLKKDN